MRLTTLLTAPALAAALALPASAQTLENLDRQTLREEIRAYLMENPEVIFEAIQVLEQKRAVAGREADRQLVIENAEVLHNDGYSYVAGNPDGDVTVVEFLDYRCGYCKRAHPEVKELLSRDPNIRLVVKEFPILGPDSVKAGKMALAALQVDRSKYGALSDALMGYRGNLTEQVAYRLADEVGYDIAALKEAAATTEIDDQLNQNYQIARTLGLEGTPAFVIGTEIIRGYLPVDEMLAAVNEARTASN